MRYEDDGEKYIFDGFWGFVLLMLHVRKRFLVGKAAPIWAGYVGAVTSSTWARWPLALEQKFLPHIYSLIAMIFVTALLLLFEMHLMWKTSVKEGVIKKVPHIP